MEEPTLQLTGRAKQMGWVSHTQGTRKNNMSKHRQQPPTIQWKWWARYAIHVATILLINATRKAKQRNKQQTKRKTKN